MAADNKNTSTFSALYHALFEELARYVRAKFGDGPPDPDEVAQIAFERFYRSAETQLVRNPRAFLYASARNVVIDHKRRHKTRDAFAEEYLHINQKKSDGLSPERVLIEKERYAILREAIEKMPSLERQVLLMHRLKGRTYGDIARESGLSESAVRRAMARAMALIDNALKAREG